VFYQYLYVRFVEIETFILPIPFVLENKLS